MMHISLNPTIAHIRAGTLRPLVVTVKERWTEYLPDVPTTAEAGLPDYEMDIWFGLVAPRGTPKPVIDQINGYMRDMVADPVARKRIVDGYIRPVSMTRGRIRCIPRKGHPALGEDHPRSRACGQLTAMGMLRCLRLGRWV